MCVSSPETEMAGFGEGLGEDGLPMGLWEEDPAGPGMPD